MCAENLAKFLVGNNLDKALVIVEAQRLAVRPEGELADIEIIALFLGLCLGQTERGNLGM